MKCNKCGTEIDELEIFCDDCKKILKKESSKREVEQLEELIENQKQLNDLENTKELVDLDKLVKEEIIKEKLEEETKIYEPVKETREERQEVKVEELFDDIDKQKKSNKKLIIIISAIIFIILITLVPIIILFTKENKIEEEVEEIIDYKKVITTYGDKITKIVNAYIKENSDIPTWQYVIEKLEYKRYEVECSNHTIYTDGSIYLSECLVNDKKTDYTYGELKEEIEQKEGKKITIYKEDYNGYSIYSNEQYKNSILVSTITCKTEECSYVNAFNQYVLIKEQDMYYLYDYTNNSINFGPFKLDSDYNVLEYYNELYGILYSEDNKNNIYNVKSGKILKDIKGTLALSDMGMNVTIMYKYNYAIFVNNNKYEFVNLKTGNVSYTIKENIREFIESNDKKLVYITAYDQNYNNFKIYNSNGKELFNGEYYTMFVETDDKLLVANYNQFKVYDKNLKLQKESKVYDKILTVHSNFAAAVNGTDLIILDIEDKEYVKFENGWDDDNYIFYNYYSGIQTKEFGNGIYITIENKKIPYGTQGNCIEYYYILETKESGFIEKINLE